MPNIPGKLPVKKLVRYVALALIVLLPAQSDNPHAVQAREEFPAQLRSAAESQHYFALPYADLLRPGEPQSKRYRRRSRRRRWRKATNPQVVEPISSARSGAVPVGPWGGEHIALQVTESGATFEIDCAHGTIEGPLSLDAQGRFDSRGEYARESGGPDMQFPRPDTHPARFTGRSDGRRMTLKITLTDTGRTMGEFELTLGAEPRMTKCL